MSAPAEQPVVISFADVTKTYRIPRRATPRLGAWMLNKLFEHNRRETFHALRGVSFEVRRGEMVGILGVNGAGKSSLLKLLAGIVVPTSGTVRAAGRIASLLELGVGFHPELSGIENIFYNGAIMGMTQEEVRERLETIVEFSGLRHYLFEPVKHYSSGMYARLACSVALHMDPDIILVDEILAVGDGDFQQRGTRRILELHDSGITIILVTHSVSQARDLCTRAMWMHEGELRADGAPREVIAEYLGHALELALAPGHFLRREPEPAGSSPQPRIAGMRAETPDGTPVEELETGQPLDLVVSIDAPAGCGPLRVALAGQRHDRHMLFQDVSPPLDPAAGEVRYRIANLPILDSVLHLSASLLAAGDDVVIDRQRDGATLRIRTPMLHVDDCIGAPRTIWTKGPGATTEAVQNQ